ncbi:hypothetical protein CDAR_525101 [Caerostris darwini]|uniref:Uncharacterized protein n=1 Tax=Caerostris darwini TaxID=1538125 RepID=A0AAV4QWP3_9ARAC|nr:hypothetical protein CDAR_525101 [Caerostris darwini]
MGPCSIRDSMGRNESISPIQIKTETLSQEQSLSDDTFPSFFRCQFHKIRLSRRSAGWPPLSLAADYSPKESSLDSRLLHLTLFPEIPLTYHRRYSRKKSSFQSDTMLDKAIGRKSNSRHGSTLNPN